MAMREKEQANSTERPIDRETVEGWLKSRRPGNSVAVVGTSVENLNKLISTGELPSYQDKTTSYLPYQIKSLKPGEYLYYGTPFIKIIKQVDPQLANDIFQQFDSSPDPETLKKTTFSDRNIFLVAKGYALNRAISDCFHHETGLYLSTDSILVSTDVLAPNILKQFFNEPLTRQIRWNMADVKALSDKEEIEKILSMDRGLALSAIRNSIKRKGLLIFFNSSLLNHRVVPGYEAEDELCIYAKKRIGQEAVSGVKTLSRFDNKAMNFR
jgi:hypothetical protein